MCCNVDSYTIWTYGYKQDITLKGRCAENRACECKTRKHMMMLWWAQKSTHHRVCHSSSQRQALLGSDRCWHRFAASYRLCPGRPGPNKCPAGSSDRRTLVPPCCGSVQTHLLDPLLAHTASPPQAQQTHTTHPQRGNVCLCCPCWPRPPFWCSCWHLPPWGGHHLAGFSLPGHSVGRSLHSQPDRRCPFLPTPYPSQWWWGWVGIRACPGRGHRRCCRGCGVTSEGGECSNQKPLSGQSLSPELAACQRWRCWPSQGPASAEGTGAPYSPGKRKKLNWSFSLGEHQLNWFWF